MHGRLHVTGCHHYNITYSLLLSNSTASLILAMDFSISVTTAGFFPLDLGFLGLVWVSGYFSDQSGFFFIRGHNFVFSHYYFPHSSHPWHLESSYKDICFTLLRIITHSCIINIIFSVEN